MPVAPRAGSVKAAKLLPEESRAVLHDVHELFAASLFDLSIGRDGDQKARLLYASGPIDRQFEPPLQETTEHELCPVERLAVGDLNEFVH